MRWRRWKRLYRLRWCITASGSPERAFIVHRVGDRPQPRCDHNAGRGISASGGRVRACPVLDVRMVALSHNTIRGAAGGAILNAELLVASDIVS